MKAPFLLTMPNYGGTLSAVRCLGERGIPVTMAADNFTAPACWSRYVTRRTRCPPIQDAGRFLEWLMDFGSREPGHVLYPTCDDLAWIVANYADELSRYYRLFQPSAEAIVRLLDKKSLFEMCRDAGIHTPDSAFPTDREDARRIARDMGYPLLLKPRTQILRASQSKGAIVDGEEALVGHYGYLAETAKSDNSCFPEVNGLEQPMLQCYRPEAATSIYSLAGFIGADEGAVAVRAARKILQRPLRLGVGLCFEEALVDRRLLEPLIDLCRRVNYFGVFEAEFVPHDGELQLIDFNPRFYGQMGFETERGLPLAYLTWLSAIGDREGLERELAAARAWREGNGYIYCNRFYLQMMVSARQLSGRMTPEEANGWREWWRAHSQHSLAFDSAGSPHDPFPGVLSAVTEVYWALRHPRSFLRQIVLDQ